MARQQTGELLNKFFPGYFFNEHNEWTDPEHTQQLYYICMSAATLSRDDRAQLLLYLKDSQPDQLTSLTTTFCDDPSAYTARANRKRKHTSTDITTVIELEHLQAMRTNESNMYKGRNTLANK